MSLLEGRSAVGEELPRVIEVVRGAINVARDRYSAQEWLLTRRYLGAMDALCSGHVEVREQGVHATSLAELVNDLGHVVLRDHPVQVTATDSRAVADEPTPLLHL